MFHSVPNTSTSSEPGGPPSSRPRNVPGQSGSRIMKRKVEDEKMGTKIPKVEELYNEEKKVIKIEATGCCSSNNVPEERQAVEEAINKEELARYREIGRRLCQLVPSDFNNYPGARKSCKLIVSRGPDILEAVRRNLQMIQSKLGEYAEGTIFAHPEELTNSFAKTTPRLLYLLDDIVGEKLQERAVLMEAMEGVAKEPKGEVVVKLEEPDQL
uniref:Uncharacterized protein n=1 Tax=Caenorhabditis japonica TaxID=281687 RepID=A0A8R1DMQ3_CAEJA